MCLKHNGQFQYNFGYQIETALWPYFGKPETPAMPDWQIFNRKREIWVETKGRIERDTVEWNLLSRCKTWNDLPQGEVFSACEFCIHNYYYFAKSSLISFSTNVLKY